MAQDDPKKLDPKKKPQDSTLKPDPETTGPEPQEHMEGPVSSLVKKVGKVMGDNDQDKDAEKDAIDRTEEKDKKKKD